MGHDVISVEPFHDSLMRIHKASSLENTQSRITLVQNAVSNRRREQRQLTYELENIGAQSLLDLSDGTFKFKFEIPERERDKYTVETILMDDLLAHVPKNREHRPYSKCLIKIDIEGMEMYAFQNARQLFTQLQVQLVFMEWKMMRQQVAAYPLIIQMINFLYSFELRPFAGETQLEKDSWREWPHDILWKRNNLI